MNYAALMYTAQLPDKGPFVIRYPRGRGVLAESEASARRSPCGQGRKLKTERDIAVITIDREIPPHAPSNGQKRSGLSIAHYDLRLKPLDEALLHEAGRNFKRIVTIEDGTRKRRYGAVLESWQTTTIPGIVERIGVPDAFIEHGTVQSCKNRLCGMDEEGIYNILIRMRNDE